MNWPEVQGKFLAGTARSKGTEGDALNDAALFSAMRRAGFVAAKVGPDPISEAGVEDLPEFTAGADDLLRCLDEGSPLVEEWCQEATRRGWRAPNVRLPELLSFAAKNAGSRGLIRSVLGQRGLWLASLNPQWASAFSVEPEIDADEARRLWDEGTRAERRGILSALTTRDPALRRELIESTWKQEPAKTRVEFVETFGEGVWPEDEEFLTRCLTDRSMDVRYTAALVLGLLQGSAVGEEVYELAREFVQVTPSVEINAPQMDDARLDRFGIASVKGPVKLDERLGRLMRLIALVGPWRWESGGERPSTLVGRIPQDQKGRSLRDGLTLAARFYRDSGWAEALVEMPQRTYADGTHLIDLLSRPAQERIAQRLWESKHEDAQYRFHQFAITKHAWSPEFTRWFLQAVTAEMVAKKPRIHDYWIRSAASLMSLEAAYLPGGEPPDTFRSTLEEWRRILDLRRSMHSTFERSSKP